jgi:hypothetical protein
MLSLTRALCGRRDSNWRRVCFHQKDFKSFEHGKKINSLVFFGRLVKMWKELVKWLSAAEDANSYSLSAVQQ